MKKTHNKQKTSRSSKPVHSKHFLKVYWPYIPIALIALLSFLPSDAIIFKKSSLVSSRESDGQTLAYATEISASGLLSATNSQRAANSVGSLSLNGSLSNAAQAKANDMVSRDYWSHNTPDGKEPWIFIDATGYAYQKAGENLANGYATSSATVSGWMASTSHRDNMLDTVFTEVGFGYANSSNFVGGGEKTVVVALYALPSGSSQIAQQSSGAVQSTTKKSVATSTQQNNSPTPTPSPTVTPDRINQPINTDSPVPEDTPTVSTSRLDVLLKGKARWLSITLTSITLVLVLTWIVKHALSVRKMLSTGEHFLAHHPIFDLLVISVVALAVFLSKTSGVVK